MKRNNAFSDKNPKPNSSGKIKKTFMWTLLGTSGLLAAWVFMLAPDHPRDTGQEKKPLPQPSESKPEHGAVDLAEKIQPVVKEVTEKDSIATFDAALQKTLAMRNFWDRQESLRQWALSVPLSEIRPVIQKTTAVRDKVLRSEAHYALFARWASEDPENAIILLRKMEAEGTL